MADDLACIDRLIRPLPQEQISCLHPQGLIFLDEADEESSTLAKAIRGVGLRLSTSRCGDMQKALHLFEQDPLGQILGKLLITNHLTSADLTRAFALAARPESVKIAIHHTIG